MFRVISLHILIVLLYFIEELDNLWFISNIFPNNINVSLILGRKIKNVSLS
jgi:hypothetical protein